MIKLSARDAGRAWDSFEQKCNVLFGTPNHYVAALASELPCPAPQVVLASKFLIAHAYYVHQLGAAESVFTEWLKYLPRFIANPNKVTTLNTMWEARNRGEKLSNGECEVLDQFLSLSASDADRITLEVMDFLDGVKKTIGTEDRLFSHKVCALLGVEYESERPSFGRILFKTLFPNV